MWCNKIYKNMKKIILLTVLVFIGFVGHSQSTSVNDTIKVLATRLPNGELVPTSWLPEVIVFGHMTDEQRRLARERTRLRNAVYVTYPYAIKAGKLINEINAKLVGVDGRRNRKAIIRIREREVKAQFTDKMKGLSVYQGKVLMKLINRETGDNCYEIVEEYKGWIDAVFWQGLAKLFGSNLKQSYDPVGADMEIEKYVQEVRKLYGYTS